ncbi:SAM-dependent methyltransferase [Microlunatus sp. Gsoil 973]|uniref:SAM-dependent methyltransferase n=1 Tax=Microlunatus sp. Gsoil 973 TaxID=2672569 RepID=UPI0018A88195|nr:SAM-dependent methyltransferase [Microlunatus sp. Gsoil 973]
MSLVRRPRLQSPLLSDSASGPEPQRSWYDAWRDSALGAGGFWHSERPGDHFRTAAGGTGLLAQMLLALIAGSEISTVVDLGAGDGRLLAEIGALAPRLRLIGLDVRTAPPGLPPAAAWLRGQWDAGASLWHPLEGVRPPGPLRSVVRSVVPRDGAPMLIVCAEWLDELPAVVAVSQRAGWRQVLVDVNGAESVGGPVPAADAAWLDRWWTDGSRAESGFTRDAAWSAVIDCLRPSGGVAVMIDYGHRRGGRLAAGSLTGYRRGRQVLPRPSAETNLTAHVAVDSLQAAGEASGARTELMISQREAVDRLLPGPGRTERSDTLARLQEVSERRLLADALGDHWWLVQSVVSRTEPRHA